MSLFLTLMLLQSTAAPAQAAQPAPTPDDAKIVCKSINTTGSRLDVKRACMSKKEWRRLQEQNAQATREIQDNHSKQGSNQ